MKYTSDLDASNWVWQSAPILSSISEDILNWENFQITATNTAEYILILLSKILSSQVYCPTQLDVFFRDTAGFVKCS